MKSKVFVALAFTGLLMTAIPLTGSANDNATCWHKPAWGYQHPNWYRGWRRMHCATRYGYHRNYLGNGGGRWLFAPAYSQYEGPRYYDDDRFDCDDWRGHDNGWHRGWRAEHQHWNHAQGSDRGRGRPFHREFRNQHEHH